MQLGNVQRQPLISERSRAWHCMPCKFDRGVQLDGCLHAAAGCSAMCAVGMYQYMDAFRTLFRAAAAPMYCCSSGSGLYKAAGICSVAPTQLTGRFERCRSAGRAWSCLLSAAVAVAGLLLTAAQGTCAQGTCAPGGKHTDIVLPSTKPGICWACAGSSTDQLQEHPEQANGMIWCCCSGIWLHPSHPAEVLLDSRSLGQLRGVPSRRPK